MKPNNCDRFYQKAMYVARKSTMRQQHGCVIVYNNKEIVAEGYNHTRNNNMENIYSIHAEMEAIKKLRQVMRKKDKNYINRCKLYVVRIGTGITDALLKQSSPCPHCAKAIDSIGIPRVCFSIDEEHFEECYRPRNGTSIPLPRNGTSIPLPPRNNIDSMFSAMTF